ncbi:MAG: cbb3-type cytochrome oxidase assembly protein CcoS [Verrucomicrobiae bacterium]|nr:cbb3-type cytochrome oxidase assembly protein CcoS [Verrucomicrobiae bacterium]
MEVILLLILASLMLALLFLGIFIWATRSGQFEDTTTPALRILADDPRPRTPASNTDSSKSNPS